MRYPVNNAGVMWRGESVEKAVDEFGLLLESIAKAAILLTSAIRAGSAVFAAVDGLVQTSGPELLD